MSPRDLNMDLVGFELQPITGPDCSHMVGDVACRPRHCDPRFRPEQTSGQLHSEFSHLACWRRNLGPVHFDGLGSGCSVVSVANTERYLGRTSTRYWSSVVTIEDNRRCSVECESNAK